MAGTDRAAGGSKGSAAGRADRWGSIDPHHGQRGASPGTGRMENSLGVFICSFFNLRSVLGRDTYAFCVLIAQDVHERSGDSGTPFLCMVGELACCP